MSPHVNAIAGRLSLRPPQREALEILARVTTLAPPRKGGDVAAALAAIRAEYPAVTDFEREFPSLCFALATGVGKTRLMGAFIAYLHLAHGIDNFFVLAPNLTIYDKLVSDFTPNTAKYVFTGIAEFATQAPEVITGDNYQSRVGTLLDALVRCKINIFNISKINSEVRGGRSPRIKRLSEYIGQSYFEYLAALPDLVLLMDESHRYRASAGVRAINELKPVLGLELTATPVVESGARSVRFRNVILDYPLGRAMADGFVKEPAVVTRKDFDASGMSAEAVERLKLEDGIRLHEQTKVLLETYARDAGVPIVKPFVLVIARDTTHAAQLVQLIESAAFFAGRYAGKVIQVDSSRTGAQEDEMVARLLKVEHADEPTEIVVHVNMLKEGWDVTNLYTIVPLRAANARVLIEQSIGRGLRLPYGRRTGVAAVDRLNIVAHDRFQEIVNEANRPDSPIHLHAVQLDGDALAQPMRTLVAQPILATRLGLMPAHLSAATEVAGAEAPPAFTDPAEQHVARVAYDAIRALANQPETVPRAALLTSPEVQELLVREVEAQWQPEQLELQGVTKAPDIAAVVARTASLVVGQTIDIPRILVLPKSAMRSGFKPFALDLRGLNYAAPSDELWIQYLRTGAIDVVGLGERAGDEAHLEDNVVSGLMDFDDVAYDEHATMLYELAGQVVAHLRNYLSEEDTRRVLRLHQRDIANFVHAQMQQHYWEEEVGFDVVVKGWTSELKPCAYAAAAADGVLDVRHSPADKSNMARYLFGGFSRCLYPVAKFHSEAERILAVILEREAEKWFKPVKGEFRIYFRSGADQLEYQPDFVAETAERIYMLEPKARNQMTDADVLAKQRAAIEWCHRASDYAATCGGKPWQYALIPHDAIADNMTLAGLASAFGVRD